SKSTLNKLCSVLSTLWASEDSIRLVKLCQLVCRHCVYYGTVDLVEIISKL
ncbi:hypothetical protein FOZ63_015058, partial [Perkinsus olseni]